MKNNLEEIDLLIKEALHEDDVQIYDDLGEQGVFEMVFGLFQGKKRWYIWITFTISIIMLGLAIYCFSLFANAENIKDMLVWGGLGTFFVFTMSMLKIFHWLQMDKNAIIREMKRMELQIARLQQEMNKENK